jgi:hypothetical protein
MSRHVTGPVTQNLRDGVRRTGEGKLPCVSHREELGRRWDQQTGPESEAQRTRPVRRGRTGRCHGGPRARARSVAGSGSRASKGPRSWAGPPRSAPR